MSRFGMAGVTAGAAFTLAGGTNDDPFTGGTQAGAGLGAVTYVNHAGAPTGKAARLAAVAADQVRVYHSYTGARSFRGDYAITPRVLPSGGPVDLSFLINGSFAQVMVVRLATTGKVQILSQAGSAVTLANGATSSTATLAVDTRYRVEFYGHLDTTPSSTNGVLTVKLYTGQSTTALETLYAGTAFNLGTVATVVRNQFFKNQASGSGSITIDFDSLQDDIGVSETPFGPYDPNTAPTVTVDGNRTAEPLETISHTAVGSDLEGPVTYAWSRVSGPTVALSGVTGATVSYRAPLATSNSTLVLRCTVTDTGGATASADVTDTILRAALIMRQSGSVVGYGRLLAGGSAPALDVVGPNAYTATARTPGSGEPTYYVDPTSTAGTATGTQAAPFKTAASINGVTLVPGAVVYFRRGTTLNGQVVINQSGTAAKPITLTAYGTGAQPRIIAGTSTNSSVAMAGAWGDVVDLYVGRGNFAGVDITGADNSVRGCTVTDSCSGVQVGGVRAKILGNRIIDNNRMSVNTPTPTTDDSGAFGVGLTSTDAEVAYNLISGHVASSYDFGLDGCAVECYLASRSNVHHNIADNNETFAELGGTNSTSNRFEYNVITGGSITTAKAFVTRGASDQFGPVLATVFSHNSVWLTGSDSKGIVCYGNPGANILTAQYNAIKVGGSSAFYDDGPHTEGYNVISGPTNFTLAATSVQADPLFVSATVLHLKTGSPAITAGAGAYA